MRLVRPAVVGGAALLLSASVTPAAELKPETVQAFDRYVQVTEARMSAEVAGDARFLWIDRLANDRGFAWRLNNYCSFEERAEGTLMQCESITLTRGIPFLFGVVVRPFVTSVPREKLTVTLQAARTHLTAAS